MKHNQRVEPDNIVRISAKKDIKEYITPIIIRGQPKYYNKYGCIKLQFTRDLVIKVKMLTLLLWHWGLVPTRPERIDGLRVEKGVIIGEAWSLTLTKIPAIQFEDYREFENWVEDIFNFQSK